MNDAIKLDPMHKADSYYLDLVREQRRRVGDLRRAHAHRDQGDAGRRRQAEQNADSAHTTVVIRRMMIVPVARRAIAIVMMTQPIGCVNRGWK